MDMIWVGARDDNEKYNSSFSVFRIIAGSLQGEATAFNGPLNKHQL